MERQVNKTLLGLVAILIATLVYLYTKLDYGYFSLITTFALIQSFYSDIYIKTLERIVGPVIAFVLTFFIIRFLYDYFIFYLIFSAAIIFLFSYYYARSYYSYAMLLAAITSALMSITGYTDSAQLGIRIGFYWVINIIIGALVVLIVDYFFKKYLKLPIILHLTDKSIIKTIYSDFWKATKKIDYSALLIASRITLTLLILSLINHLLGMDYINLQAIIAGTVVSAQLTLQKAHQRALFRMTGVLLGTLFAILYVLILLIFPSSLLEAFFIIFTLTLCIFLTEKFPYLDYLFFQLGMVIPLILIHPHTEQYNMVFVLHRGFGSLEGGIVGTLMEYLFYKLIKKIESDRLDSPL
jgi:uncharacterized membrane protein YccC